jgi:AraC-like DNA-binding protein
MLREPNDSVGIVAAALGYVSRTALAAADRRATGETPTDWWRRIR